MTSSNGCTRGGAFERFGRCGLRQIEHPPAGRIQNPHVAVEVHHDQAGGQARNDLAVQTL
jgi:hypothetical protein